MLGSIWRIWSFTSGVRQIRVRTSNMLGKFGKFRGEVDGIFTHHSIELPVDLNICKYYKIFLISALGVTYLTGG